MRSKWEDRLIEAVRKNALWLGAAAVLALGLYLRYLSRWTVVGDMEFYYLPWFQGAKEGGVSGLLKAECSYSPLHMYLWALWALLPLPLLDLHSLKLLAILMECGMVAALLGLVRQLSPKEKKMSNTFWAFALLWLNPIPLLNASAWGQTDTLYVAFSVLAVILLLSGKSAWAMASLGVALSFKLQAVFLFPAFAMYYFCGERKFSLLELFIIPAVWLLSGLPMALSGKSWLYAIECYFGQAGTFTSPVMNYPNLYALLGSTITKGSADAQNLLCSFGMAFSVATLGLALVWLLRKNVTLSGEDFVLLSAWCVFICVFLMPRMHDRYALVGEMLLVVWCVLRGRRRDWLYLIPVTLAVTSAYFQYLFKHEIFSLQLGAAIQLVTLLLLTRRLMRQVKSSC